MRCRLCSHEIPDGSVVCPSCSMPVIDLPDSALPEDSTAPETLDLPDPTRLERVEPASERRSVSRLGEEWPKKQKLDSRFQPGTVLAGRYRMVSVLGRGGMGEVYLAEDLKLGQKVALKFLPRRLERDQVSRARFLNEVKIARQISHPNVCRVYDVGEENGRHFISMEHIDGENLATFLRDSGRPPLALAVHIARQVAQGLAAAHQAGVLHRDLKPSNTMIDTEGRAVIMDFGLSGYWAHSESEESTGTLGGTPSYMAPEQFEGHEEPIRTDLYSLGLVLYELFTGRRAFPPGPLGQMLRLHRETTPVAPSEVVDDIDPTIEKMIRRCLAKEPRDRPSSALAVAAALPSGDAPLDGMALKTLLWSDLFFPTDLGLHVLRQHDRVMRDLLEEHGGVELSGFSNIAANVAGAGDVARRRRRFQLVFERPWNAVCYALAYQQALATLSPRGEEGGTPDGGVFSACGVIHLGEVFAQETGAVDVAPGARAVEMAEAPRTILKQMMLLAAEHQILLTRGAFDLARQGAVESAESRLCWLAHGGYSIHQAEPIEVFEVGREDCAPFLAPGETDEIRRMPGQDTILGWRPAPGLSIPQRSHWKVERRLGEGGFGEVWLAVHEKTQDRRVFKFCYEKRSLKALQHEITLFRLLKEELGERPDITRILDWNFEQAPYFIESEYTRGGSLVDWAAAQGGISEVPLADRLELVAQVADALNAAHSVGVLHKDVKPANVLVTTDGGHLQAQLTDFGVGMITDYGRLSAAGITVLGMTEMPGASTAGTRLFMAPELVEGKAATVQADIYALGVVLYQVVAGDFSRALSEGWQQKVEDDFLRDDIAVAVAGSPSQRLASARELAERLRGLDTRRVRRAAEEREEAERRRDREEARQAREDLARVRQRRRLVIAAAATLLVFAGAMLFQAQRIREEAARAEREADRANLEAQTSEQVVDFMVGLFEVSDPSEARGNEIRARDILDEGSHRIQAELGEQPVVQARLMNTMGVVYRSLGLYDDALPLIEEALRMRRELYGDEHLDVAESLHELADLMMRRGEYEQAKDYFRLALTLRRKFLGKHAAVANSLNDLAEAHRRQGDYETAEALIREALNTRRDLFGDRHPDVAESLNDLGLLHLMLADYETAEPLLRQALAMRRELLKDHPDVVASLNNLAGLLEAHGDYEAAEAHYRQSLELRRRLLGDEHPDVATGLNNLAALLRLVGDYDAAEEYLGKALDLRRRLLGAQHPSVLTNLNDLAVLYKDRGDLEAAESLYREVIAAYRQRDSAPVRLAIALNNLARLLEVKGEYAEAESLYHEALKLSQRWYGDDQHPNIAQFMCNLAGLLVARAKFDAAESRARDSLERFHALLPAEHWRIRNAESVLGASLAGQGRFEEAEDLLRTSWEALRAVRGDQAAHTRDALRRLVRLYQAWGRSDQADVYRALMLPRS